MQFWERTYLNFIFRQFDAIYRHPEGKVVLTFDDGPTEKVTEKVINVLKERNITAYFFLLGENLSEENNLSIYKENDQIVCLHGGNHLLVNIDKSWKEDNKTALVKIRSCGIDAKYARPPYGLFNKAYMKFLRENDLQLFMWNHTTYDYRAANAKQWAEKVVSQTKKGDVLLLHDSPKTEKLYPDGLNYLLDELEKRKTEVGVLPDTE